MKPRSILTRLFLLLACVSAPAARALTPYRVADIDPTFHSVGSAPDKFVRVGARGVFTASAPIPGLWSSDGTAAGTVRLTANPASVETVVATGEVLFFRACNPQGQCRFQVTDGTVPGTRALPGSPYPGASVAAAGPRRIFFVGAGPTSPGLWTSDGTQGGTRLVKRFDLASSGPPRLFVWFRDHLWFFTGDALWTSNGTAAGTRQVATVGFANQVGTAGTRLVFFATASGSSDARFWSSDGTAAGTKVLGAVTSPNSNLPGIVNAGGSAYFWLARNDPDFVSELWATDGTAAHTRKLATFGFFDVGPLVAVGSRVAFVARDDAHGSELWVSDGRPGGTRGIDVCPGGCSGVDDLEGPAAVDGGRIWFAGETPNQGEELWTSDLTPAGTRRVKDLFPGFRSSRPHDFFAGGGRVYFAAGDNFENAELWVSDATAAGTVRLARQQDSDHPFNLQFGAIASGRAFFRLSDLNHGLEPWVSDGTVAGTKLIVDLAPAQEGGSFPQILMAAGGRCFFFTSPDNDETDELWVSDGTAAGTAVAYRFESNFFPFRNDFGSVDWGGRLALFRAQGFDSGEIWVSDGTQQGTSLLHASDVRANGQMRVVGDRLFFEATDPDHGTELWASDGGPNGAVRLSDFPNSEPFPDDGFVRTGMVEVAGGVAFLAADVFGRFEPWFSDGTIGGTRHLADVYPALVAPFFTLSSDVVPSGGKIFFTSSDLGATSLWVSDLTAAGTKNLGPLVDSEGNPAVSTALAVASGRLVVFYRSNLETGFQSSDGVALSPGGGPGLGFGAVPLSWGGRLAYSNDSGDLYATDGTAAGTVRITYPDGGTIGFARLAVLGGRLAFSSFRGVWDTDGTAAGTVRRLAPYTSSTLQDFAATGTRVFFPWYDAATGTELWALRP